MKTSKVTTPLLRFVLLVGAMVFVLLPTAALAQTTGGDEYPTTPTTPTTVVVEGTVVNRADPGDPGKLPFTGGDVGLLTAVGLGAVAVGGTVVLAAGRRRGSDAS